MHLRLQVYVRTESGVACVRACVAQCCSVSFILLPLPIQCQEPLPIVTNAPNVSEGSRVVVATVGSKVNRAGHGYMAVWELLRADA